MHDLEQLVISRSFLPRFRLSLGPRNALTPQGQIATERAIIRTLVDENMPEQLRSAVAGGARLRAGLSSFVSCAMAFASLSEGLG